MSDYRCPSFVKSYGKILQKKDCLREKLKKEHPNLNNHYEWVRQEGKQQFADVYGRRCAYCGVGVNVVGIKGFQVDHLYPQKIKKNNDLKNLVFSCEKCNQKKKDKLISSDSIIHPDSDKIGEIFIRNDDYSISIDEKYKIDPEINEYYYSLELDEWTRKLDYCITVLADLIDCKMVKEVVLIETKAILGDLLILRNNANI